MNRKARVMSVFGTRPEATKMCPLVKALEGNDSVESIVCVTGQHREMLDSVLRIFGVAPDYDLDVMKPGQTVSTITADVLTAIGEVYAAAAPDIVLVHGDTTTSFAAALAAFYRQIPVGHVEAGLRTWDRYSPYPEEMNRQLTGRLAELHFAPTERNRLNLAREGVMEHVYVTGNTALDQFRYTVREGYQFREPCLRALDFGAGRYILMTAHRRENLGERLENICRGILRIANDFPDVRVIYPVHLNPAVRNTVFPLLGGKERILLCDPIAVTDMHNLMPHMTLCMTDSGGLQEEGPSFGLPVLVMRTETERPEAVDAGTVRMAGVEEDGIYSEAVRLLTDAEAYQGMASAVNPYGDGRASERIVEHIIQYFREGI